LVPAQLNCLGVVGGLTLIKQLKKMEEALAPVLSKLASLSSICAVGKLLATSRSLRRCLLASVDAAKAAAHVSAAMSTSEISGHDSFDVVVAAGVTGFYALYAVMLCRTADNVSNYWQAGWSCGGTFIYSNGRCGHCGTELQHVFPLNKTPRRTVLKVPHDGISLHPINCERVIHEGTNGFWAHGKMRIGSDIPAGLWHLDVSGLSGSTAIPMRSQAARCEQYPYIGFANDYGPWLQMSAIDAMDDFNIWEGMKAGFKIDVPGKYELTLRPYSQNMLVAELSTGEGYSHARIRYLPRSNGPYHLVAHIPTCGDWLDCEPPCMLRISSCSTGCSCICATSHAESKAFSTDTLREGESTEWDVSLPWMHALRCVA